MNQDQLQQMGKAKGFIGALDQSGGSTPKALKAYGVDESMYDNEEKMYDLIHEMRTRMLTSPSFSGERLIGVILFENTMKRKVNGKFTGEYCWDEKRIVPFLKVDKGLQEEKDGVQLMKDFDGLSELLKEANKHKIFGTKMRSVIKQADPAGIKAIVKQQFEWAKLILDHDLMPIIEPEVDIHCPEKAKAEEILKEEIKAELAKIDRQVMLKLTIPTVVNFYEDLIAHDKVLRVVALSGGYSREHANELLEKNNGMIASFSRALAEGLSYQQSEEDFNSTLKKSIDNIYKASIS